jgi:hypothetical protein
MKPPPRDDHDVLDSTRRRVVGKRHDHRDGRGDEGSILPLILLCFLVGLLFVAGSVTASSAFLAQRDLQSDCDGAAVTAAAAVDSPDMYTPDRGVLAAELTLAVDAAETAVQDYASRSGMDETSFAVTVSGRAEVAVDCGRTVRVPFGEMFGFADGLNRSAHSGARSPVRP